MEEFIVETKNVETQFSDTNNRHEHDNAFAMLPFITKQDKIVNMFTGVRGSFIRLVNKRETNKSFDVQKFLDELLNNVTFEQEEDKYAFKCIAKDILISDEKIANVNVESLNYIPSTSEDEKIGVFLYSILGGEKVTDVVEQLGKSESSNVLYEIVFNKLLINKTGEGSKIKNYKCIVPFIQELFYNDFTFIANDGELFKNTYKRLLEYYYLFYILQVSLKINEFEKMDRNTPKEVFFTLGWEKTSKSRIAYTNGWINIQDYVNNLFSHAVTLEMLNCSACTKNLDYLDIYNRLKNMNYEDVKPQIRELKDTYNEWMSKLQGTKVSEFDQYDFTNCTPEMIEIKELFYLVDNQFRHSGRSARYRDYRMWVTKFVEDSFGKKRGKLGYSLKLNEEDILLFTRIICGQAKGRIRLNKLFVEFKNRGMSFDRESKEKIVALYEKLNLLEKKSDSGDAQYVRTIL